MKTSRKILIAISTLASVVFLTACDGSSHETSEAVANQSNNDSSQVKENDSSNTDSQESSQNTQEVKSDSSADTEASLKEKYLKKFDDTKKMAEELKPSDSSTYALKKVENDRWKMWDELLNEIYGVLKEQLPQEEMDQLRDKQREWIKYRDDSALEASEKYKGGTQEHLEYVAVLANLTEERCYELIQEYMK